MRGWLASISLLTAPKLPLPRTTCLHGITSAARWNSNRPKAKQSLGQNFLSDTTIARRIVEGLDDTLGTLRAGDDDGFRVIELGPGQGALTGHLLATYPAMTAVEIDQRMIEVRPHHHPHHRHHYPCSTATTTPPPPPLPPPPPPTVTNTTVRRLRCCGRARRPPGWPTCAR